MLARCPLSSPPPAFSLEDSDMRRFACIFLLAFALSLSLLSHPAPAKENQEKVEAFNKRYLTVTPPRGWRMEQESSPSMFEDCMTYMQEDGRLGVMACPHLGRDSSFAEVKRAFMQDSHFTLHDRCLIGKDEEMAVILTPLKNDREDRQGAFFIVFSEEPARDDSSGNKDILQKSRPMLRLFTHFYWPKEVLADKIK